MNPVFCQNQIEGIPKAIQCWLRSSLVVIACLQFLLMAVAEVQAEKRVALVIGNSAYENVPPLANPKNDAEAMTRKLFQLGFQVTEGVDLNKQQMEDLIRSFVYSLRGADKALFYYAGHGLQVNGENYMAPIDASLRDRNDLEFETIPFNLVLSSMERNSKTNMVFLDACRDNPLARNLSLSLGTRSGSVGSGLAQMGAGIGTFVSFSTEPGAVAFDGEGEHSPYTKALLEHLGKPGESLSVSMVKVRNDVIESTKGAQVPWEHSSLTGEVVLKQEKAKESGAVLATQGPASSKPASGGSTEIELAFWNSIRDSDNPKLFEAYLAQYPNGPFVIIAKLKLSELQHESSSEASELAAVNAETNGTVEEKTASQHDTNGEPQISPSLQTTTSENVNESNVDTASLGNTENADVLAEEDEPLAVSQKTIRSIQEELNRIGCSAGKADGLWGRKSENALQQYGKHSGKTFASLEPTNDLLPTLRAERNRICPLICNRGFEIKGGKCVRKKQKTATVNPNPANKQKTQSKPSQKQSTARKNSAGQICYVCKRGGRKFCSTRDYGSSYQRYPWGKCTRI